MEALIRNVGDLNTHDRKALEHVLGLPLSEDQQLVIQVVNLNIPANVPANAVNPRVSFPTLPAWCNVYEGLADSEIEDLDQAILQRADLGRSAE